MRARGRYISVPIDTEVDVDLMEVLTDLSDEELADFNLYRVGGNSEGAEQVFDAVRDFHNTHHGGLMLGCTQPLCADLNHDSVNLIGQVRRQE